MVRRITTPEHSQSSPPDPDLTAGNLPAPSRQAGMRIRDYEIVRELGHGGMGQVYLVRNVISDRLEAMKILLPELAQDQELTARFTREIKTLASLEHPNIAQLRTAFSTDDQFMMVMEYVEGDTLAHRLEPGPFSVADALNYIGQVLSALSYAHAKGVIHRDIKPANMMLTTQGVVKLMDFGIARSGSEAVMTVPGTTMGSLDYMSPEQVRGEGVDARSDLYSVGVSLYQMVTRARMFSATSSYAIMEAQVKQMPRPPIELQPSLPKALNDIIMFSVAKDPAQRFQNADAFRNALASVSVAAAAAGGVAAQPSVPFPAVVTPPRVIATPLPAMTPPPMTPALSTPVSQPSASVTPLPPQPVRSHIGWIIVAAIVILVAVVAYMALGPKQVTVPDLTGSNLPDAAAKLQALHLAIGHTTLQEDRTKSPGIILSQSPSPNTRVDKGTTVDIVLSPLPTPAGMVEVPPLVGKSFDAAQQALQDLHLTVGNISREPKSDVARNTVLDEFPKPGKKVDSGTAIDLVVSEVQSPPQPRLVQVPRVLGKSLDQARVQLQNQGLSLGRVAKQTRADVAPNTVLNQLPASGQQVQKASHVDLAISIGPPKPSTIQAQPPHPPPAKEPPIVSNAIPQNVPSIPKPYDRGIEDNMWFSGPEVPEFVPSEATWKRCYDACVNNPQCRAFMYIRPNETYVGRKGSPITVGPTGMCRLKTAVTVPKPDKCCISGFVRKPAR